MGFAPLPVPQLVPIFDADGFEVLEIVHEGVGVWIAISGVPLKGAVDDFLKLRGDRRVRDGGRDGLRVKRAASRSASPVRLSSG